MLREGAYVDLFAGCSGTDLSERLAWLAEPESWRFSGEGLEVAPKAKTDFFRPHEGVGRDNAALLYTGVRGDFTAATLAEADLVAFGDAAALTIRSSEQLWAKICIERSPVGDVSVVSVVTRDWSDDANGELLDRPTCRLRITRKGHRIGMHYSTDGKTWRFVRAVGLPMPDEILVGIHAQAPYRGGCRALFRSFTLEEKAVEDFRSGE
jgi:regulation of enolase protein 1 (concanavalin A-like superfamily)